jgi:hypothetical protein
MQHPERNRRQSMVAPQRLVELPPRVSAREAEWVFLTPGNRHLDLPERWAAHEPAEETTRAV